ncbi:MAG TPA: DUF427 domain-containing protein, partial [Acidimicrobiales bacterium]|nr:DUF427 domain-containing protein [Acidimicrobiales bacterium]
MDSRAQRGLVRVEPCPKRIRAYFGQELVLDTVHALLVWESPSYPTYYVPVGDVLAELSATGAVERSPSRGDAEVYDVKVARATAVGAALWHRSSPIEELREAVKVRWAAMDEWLEEDEPVYTHPRDPYRRVDILASS